MDSEDLDEKVDGHGTGRSGPHGIKQRGRGSIRPEREPIYDTEAMHEKLEDFGWSDIVPWEETLVISGTDPAQVENVDDDLARELAFYNQVRWRYIPARQSCIGPRIPHCLHTAVFQCVAGPLSCTRGNRSL